MQTNNRSLLLAGAMIILAIVTRFIPHPFNFTAVGAIALFGGATIRDKRYAFLIPLLALLISDAVLGFHISMIPVYACFAFTVLLGITIQHKHNAPRVVLASLVSSVVFFLVTNLPVWYMDLSLYPVSFAGTMQSYSMAIPFFFNQAAGDLFYNGILFTGYFALSRKFVAVSR